MPRYAMKRLADAKELDKKQWKIWKHLMFLMICLTQVVQYRYKTMNKILNEDMDADALRGLINLLISIDQYKSKMGEDKDIVVVCFKVKDKFPAKDLSRFIEFGDKSLLDVEVSSGSDKDSGEFKVYVEIKRDRKLFDRLDSLLNDIRI